MLWSCTSPQSEEASPQEIKATPAQPTTPQKIQPAVRNPTPGNQPLPPISPSGTGIFSKKAPQAQTDPQKSALCPGCDVFIISLCSLRKDHVGLFNSNLFPESLTPHIDSLKQGHQFTQARSASNFTLAGLTAILTGRFGSSTGVTGWDKGLTKDLPTLPEVFGIYGYETAAFTIDSASGFRPDYGLDRGFQHMQIDSAPPKTPDGRTRAGNYVEGAAALPLIQWLNNRKSEKPLFAMFHSRTAHFPFVISAPEDGTDPTGLLSLLYEAGHKRKESSSQNALPGMAGGTAQKGVLPEGRDPLQAKVRSLGEAGVEIWKEAYKDSIIRMDKDVGVILESLRASGKLEKSIVVVVADHGESLNEHNELLHGASFFDGVTNVPLIISVPNLPSEEQHSALVSHVDLMPTLLDLIGAVPPAGIDGTSLLPIMLKKETTVRTIALAEGGVAKHDQKSLPVAIYSLPWILLRQEYGCGESRWPPGPVPLCLYDIDKDPLQKQNLAWHHPNIIDDLTQKWQMYRKSHAMQKGVPLQLSDAFIEELRQNGYDFEKGAP